MTQQQNEAVAVTLLPCPFCGDADDFNPSISESHRYAEPGNPAAGLILSGYYTECDKCTGSGPHKDTKAEAIAAWNTRTTEARLSHDGGEGVLEAVPCVNCPDCGHRLPAQYTGPCICGAELAAIRALKTLPVSKEAGEVKRLREALQRIRSGRSSVTECALIARAALGETRP